MAEESFRERARQEMIKAAKQYKDIYVDYEYLICSVTFEKNDYYIIAVEEDNFQHLTGVQSKIDAKPNTAIYEVKEKVWKYKNCEPFPSQVKAVNTIIGKTMVGKTLTEAIDELRLNLLWIRIFLW